MRLLGARGGGHGRRGGGRQELIEAHGYDTKYAMHCARLGFQCIELLSTGGLTLPIQGEPADWLRAVRHGTVDFDDWWNRSLELDAQLESMQSDDSVPTGSTGVGLRHGSQPRIGACGTGSALPPTPPRERVGPSARRAVGERLSRLLIRSSQLRDHLCGAAQVPGG